MPFPRHHESAIPDRKDSGVGSAIRVRANQRETSDGCDSGRKLSLQVFIKTARALFEASPAVIPYNQGKNPDYQNVVDFCKLFNIELKKIRDRRIPKNLKKHEGVLITPWNFKGTGSHHCLRFCGHVSEKKFVVLDPSPLDGQQFPVWGKAYIKDWCCDVFCIRLKDP